MKFRNSKPRFNLPNQFMSRVKQIPINQEHLMQLMDQEVMLGREAHKPDVHKLNSEYRTFYQELLLDRVGG